MTDVSEFVDQLAKARKILGLVEDEIISRFEDEAVMRETRTGNLLRAMAELHRILAASARVGDELNRPKTVNILNIVTQSGLPVEQQEQMLVQTIQELGLNRARDEGLISALFRLAGSERAQQLLELEA